MKSTKQARTGLCAIVPVAQGPFRGLKMAPWPGTHMNSKEAIV